MKESEAKTKLCPLAFSSDHDRCIASGCMMWQRTPTTEKSAKKEKPDGCGWVEADCSDHPVKWYRYVSGDCGLKNNLNDTVITGSSDINV